MLVLLTRTKQSSTPIRSRRRKEEYEFLKDDMGVEDGLIARLADQLCRTWNPNLPSSSMTY